MKLKSTSLRTALAGLLLASTWLVSVANAALIDRGNGMIYDSTQDITWLQNANLAGTTMNWDDSVTWAAGLTVGGFSQEYYGYNCTTNELA